ncbi:hypothetical protein ACWD5Z_23135 [Micromonospora chokoriensis]
MLPSSAVLRVAGGVERAVGDRGVVRHPKVGAAARGFGLSDATDDTGRAFGGEQFQHAGPVGHGIWADDPAGAVAEQSDPVEVVERPAAGRRFLGRARVVLGDPVPAHLVSAGTQCFGTGVADAVVLRVSRCETVQGRRAFPPGGHLAVVGDHVRAAVGRIEDEEGVREQEIVEAVPVDAEHRDGGLRAAGICDVARVAVLGGCLADGAGEDRRKISPVVVRQVREQRGAEVARVPDDTMGAERPGSRDAGTVQQDDGTGYRADEVLVRSTGPTGARRQTDVHHVRSSLWTKRIGGTPLIIER